MKSTKQLNLKIAANKTRNTNKILMYTTTIEIYINRKWRKIEKYNVNLWIKYNNANLKMIWRKSSKKQARKKEGV